MKLILHTDNYGYETSWLIEDVDSEELYNQSSTTYSSNQLYIEELCLDPATCYIFTILDSYGDGIISPGYYEIYYNDNLIRPASAFAGSSESTTLPCGLN